MASIAVSMILGFVYFGLSPRVFQAKAQILVRHSQSDSSSVQMMADRNTQDQMATFERLLKSTVVLERAIGDLDCLPPEISRSATLEEALDELRDMLGARAIRRTSIIELTCRSEDPEATVNIVNAVVSSYLRYMDENHKSVSTEVVSLLKQERNQLEANLLQRERELVLEKHQSSDLGLEGDSGYVHPTIQSVITINDAVLTARQRRVQLQATQAALEQTINAGGDLRQHMLALEPLIGRDLLLSAIGLNPHDTAVLSELEEANVDNRGQLEALKKHYGPNHPKIQKLQATIAASNQYAVSFQKQLQQRINGMQSAQLGNMLVNLVKEDLASTIAQEQRLMAEYQATQAQAKDLITSRSKITIMERDVESLRELKSTLIARIGTIEINDTQADVRVSIVSHPRRPDHPISPVLPQLVLLSLLAGIMIGTAIVYVRDAIDDKFRSPEEIQEQLGLPLLAMIQKHQIRDGSGLDTLLVHHSPNAQESEAFRTLRTTLAFSGNDCRRIVVSSSEPSDGKTTVLANLGVSATQSGKRTLLIDCDLRRPGLTNLFQLRRMRGIAEILRSGEEIGALAQETIVSSGLPGLDVLPSGRRPPDPAELLTRERFSDFIAWAESEYDQILIDSPPVLAATDASIIARHTDGMIVVVQPQKNHRRNIIRAIESLHRMGTPLLGIVANAIDVAESSYGGYGYGYGSGYGYGEGYGDETDDADDSIMPEHDFAPAFPNERLDDATLPMYPTAASATVASHSEQYATTAASANRTYAETAVEPGWPTAESSASGPSPDHPSDADRAMASAPPMPTGSMHPDIADKLEKLRSYSTRVAHEIPGPATTHSPSSPSDDLPASTPSPESRSVPPAASGNLAALNGAPVTRQTREGSVPIRRRAS